MPVLRAGRLLAAATGLAILAVAATGAAALALGPATAQLAPVADLTPLHPIAPISVPVRTLNAGPTPASVTPDPPPVLVTPVLDVRPLTSLVVPDLLLTGGQPLTAAQLAAVRAITGVDSVVPVAVGTVALAQGAVTALGVDPSTFRSVTPNSTAASDPLWASVARGELMATYDVAAAQHLVLGSTQVLAGQQVRVGSFADLRMPGIGAVVDTPVAAALGLVPNAGIVVTAPSRDVVGLERQVLEVIGPHTAAILRPRLPTGGHATMGKALYVAAAKTCPGLSWTVLAAIGGIESDHGADTAVSSAGAEGPMQFMPATFAEYAVDGDHDGIANIDDPYDAVYTAARMLCDDGAGRGGAALTAALFAYNHATWYPPEVLSLAERYAHS
ncbi:MAG TPA: lytic transglycosylase domain-containing protein [Mycobacteriales bacterium]